MSQTLSSSLGSILLEKPSTIRVQPIHYNGQSRNQSTSTMKFLYNLPHYLGYIVLVFVMEDPIIPFLLHIIDSGCQSCSIHIRCIVFLPSMPYSPFHLLFPTLTQFVKFSTSSRVVSILVQMCCMKRIGVGVSPLHCSIVGTLFHW